MIYFIFLNFVADILLKSKQAGTEIHCSNPEDWLMIREFIFMLTLSYYRCSILATDINITSIHG